jgi:hypothetical protein
MTSEVGGPEHDPPHIEFDPAVKWPEINQVNAATPGESDARLTLAP